MAIAIAAFVPADDNFCSRIGAGGFEIEICRGTCWEDTVIYCEGFTGKRKVGGSGSGIKDDTCPDCCFFSK